MGWQPNGPKKPETSPKLVRVNSAITSMQTILPRVLLLAFVMFKQLGLQVQFTHARLLS